MKAVLVLVITWTVLVSEIVTTVQTASARGSRVSVIYVAPKDAAHQPIYEHLKERSIRCHDPGWCEPDDRRIHGGRQP